MQVKYKLVGISKKGNVKITNLFFPLPQNTWQTPQDAHFETLFSLDRFWGCMGAFRTEARHPRQLLGVMVVVLAGWYLSAHGRLQALPVHL